MPFYASGNTGHTNSKGSHSYSVACNNGAGGEPYWGVQPKAYPNEMQGNNNNRVPTRTAAIP